MAMVEMIFVLPLLLFIVFAIAQFGLMFNRWLTLSNAVREGARTAVVFRAPCNPGTVTTDVQGVVASYAQAGGVGIDAADVNVTGTLCGSPSGNTVTVDATFDFELRIPFSDLGTIPLSSSSAMRRE